MAHNEYAFFKIDVIVDLVMDEEYGREWYKEHSSQARVLRNALYRTLLELDIIKRDA